MTSHSVSGQLNVSQTVAILRPGARTRPRSECGIVPPWVVLGRHDLLALIHGLPVVLAGDWVTLVAEALSAGQDALSEDRCKEVAGKRWLSLKERLIRTGRIQVDGDLLRFTWVGHVLADAAKRIAKGRKMRAGHDK